MNDNELIDLIRKGASGWSGPTASAAGAKFSASTMKGRWRSVAISAAAAAAVLLFALAVAGGRVTFVQTILSAVESQKATSQSEPTPSPVTEPSPSPATEPVAQPQPEPTPKPRTEPTPAPKQEPVPSPEPVHSPTPPEASPTPGTK